MERAEALLGDLHREADARTEVELRRAVCDAVREAEQASDGDAAEQDALDALDALVRGAQRAREALVGELEALRIHTRALDACTDERRAVCDVAERSARGLAELHLACDTYGLPAEAREAVAAAERALGEAALPAIQAAFASRARPLAAAQTRAAGRLRRLAGAFRIFRQLEGAGCPICMSREIAAFCVPCGHTYCATCKPDPPARCYMCRTRVERTCRLFSEAQPPLPVPMPVQPTAHQQAPAPAPARPPNSENALGNVEISLPALPSWFETGPQLLPVAGSLLPSTMPHRAPDASAA